MPLEVHAGSAVVVSPDVVTEDLGVGGVVVNLHTVRPTSLDRVGMAMWKALRTARSVEGAVEILVSHFTVNREVLERDLIVFVGQLAELDLVTVADESSPTGKGESQVPSSAIDAFAVMERRHHDWIAALIAYARESDVSGKTVTIDSAGPTDLGDSQIAVLHFTHGCLPLPREEFSALCRRVSPEGVVIVDNYNDPAWRRSVDAVRFDGHVTSHLEPMGWSSVWWRMHQSQS